MKLNSNGQSSTQQSPLQKEPGKGWLRYASFSDIPTIMLLFTKMGAASSMMLHRSEAYIATQIEKGYAVVLEDGQKRVVSYCEIVVLDTEQAIRSILLEKFQFRNFKYQGGDVFIYIAGLASDKTKAKRWTHEIFRYLEAHYLPAERSTRTLWAQPQQSIKTDTASSSYPSQQTQHIKPRRVMLAVGVTDGGIGIDLAHHFIADGFLGEKEGPSYTCVVPHVLADGTGRGGMLHICHIDPPLSQQQRERTKRNRYLITEREQRRLLATRIGIVGLSTGSVVLEALLREGIGGIYRLADFDTFEVSNSNRMLYGSHDVGKSKVKLCRERILSVDSSLLVEEFPEGLTPENLASFVSNCDLIIEECDDFPVKLMIRDEARKAKVPLLMGTSQNGMVDVERYDIDPTCTPFHYVGRPTPIKKENAESGAKNDDGGVPGGNAVALSYYDSREISPRFMASFGEMGRSISSWPQLAEEVFLNSATVAHASRRILLGDSTIVSGRFAVRMDRLFTPQNRCSTGRPSLDAQEGLAVLPRPPFAMDPNLEDDMKKLFFVNYWARTAPSWGNLQPWDTKVTMLSGNEVPFLEVSFRRDAFVNDYVQEWNEVALGCLLENAEIAVAYLGLGVEMEEIDTSISASYATRISLTNNSQKVKEISSKKRLFYAMSRRSSVRTTEPFRAKLPSELTTKLEKLGVAIVQKPSKTVEVIRRAIVDERERRFVSAEERQQLLKEIGAGNFKIHPAVLGLSEKDKQALFLLGENPATMDFMVKQGFHKALLESYEKELANTPCFFVLCDSSSLNTGNCLQRDNVWRGRLLETAWLEITHFGLGARPFSLWPAGLQSLNIPNAFFVLTPVEPCPLGFCSSRL